MKQWKRNRLNPNGLNFLLFSYDYPHKSHFHFQLQTPRSTNHLFTKARKTITDQEVTRLGI